MQVNPISNEHFAVIFDDDDEFKTEYASNLSAGGLCLPIKCELDPFETIQLTLKLGTKQIIIDATVVRLMDDAVMPQ